MNAMSGLGLEGALTQNVVSAAFLVISGKNADGISVKNTVTWQYDLEMCDKIPMAIGDTIGWVDVVGLNYAKVAFCAVGSSCHDGAYCISYF